MSAPRRLLAALAVFAFVIVLGSAILVPLYTDEIASSYQLSHALTEGGGQGSFMAPLCRGVFRQTLHLTAYPAALFYSIFFSPLGLFGLRLSSVIVVIGWFVAIWRTTRAQGFASFVSLHAFGTMPLALVTARGEPITLVCLGVLAALALRRRARWTWRAHLAVAAVSVLTISILYETHPRALFYTPFALACAVLAFPRARIWSLAVGVFVLVTAGQTFTAARAAAACPNGPRVEEILRSLSVEPSHVARHPELLVRDIGQFAVVMTASMSLEPEPELYHWIPEDPATWLSPPTVRIADRLNHGALIALFAGMPLFVLVGAARARRRPRHRARALLAALLVASVLASVALNSIDAFYNVAGVMPMLAFACLLAAPAFEGMSRTLTGTVTTLLQVCALASLLATIGHVGPRLVALAGRTGTIFPDRPATIPALHASAERSKIRAQASACGIADGARHLVVDDATLFAFDHLREPIDSLYATDAAMWGLDYPGVRDVELLRRLGASGLITRCVYLPTALTTRVKRDGDYCCISPITE